MATAVKICGITRARGRARGRARRRACDRPRVLSARARATSRPTRRRRSCARCRRSSRRSGCSWTRAADEVRAVARAGAGAAAPVPRRRDARILPPVRAAVHEGGAHGAGGGFATIRAGLSRCQSAAARRIRRGSARRQRVPLSTGAVIPRGAAAAGHPVRRADRRERRRGGAARAAVRGRRVERRRVRQGHQGRAPRSRRSSRECAMRMYDLPDASGHFGPYGGVFVAETLIHALDELKARLRALPRRPGVPRRVRLRAQALRRAAEPRLSRPALVRALRRRADLPQARGPEPHRRAQDQQRDRPGAARAAHGQAARDRRDRRRHARRRGRHDRRALRHGVRGLHGRGGRQAPGRRTSTA